jgi:hypothetical protein
LEEVIGAYSLGREILGDRKHHVAHLVGEALGATGLIQELRARDKLDEEEQARRWEKLLLLEGLVLRVSVALEVNILIVCAFCLKC